MTEYVIDLFVSINEEEEMDSTDDLNLLVPEALEDKIPNLKVISINAYENQGEVG